MSYTWQVSSVAGRLRPCLAEAEWRLTKFLFLLSKLLTKRNVLLESVVRA